MAHKATQFLWGARCEGNLRAFGIFWRQRVFCGVLIATPQPCPTPTAVYRLRMHLTVTERS